MRLATIEVVNYKGIARARLEETAEQAVVTISGRNGTGKSLFLEAVIAAWSSRYNLAESIGPWSDELCVTLEFRLTPSEWEAVDDWHQRFYSGPAPRIDALTLEMRASRLGNQYLQKDSTTLQTLRNSEFQKRNPFSRIDLLAASRLVPNSQNAVVDLAMLGQDRVDQDRWNMLDSFIRQRSPMSLPSVGSYLVTLDYQAFLAQRQRLTVENEYERLADAFLAATGKTLLLPEYDPARGSNVEIALPSGHRHDLGALSSGEQEMLAIMYFVRRLSASGGILCIDEPEQHLHPTLQAALFDAMQDLADRAQIFVVSHSVNLIAAAPIGGLVQLKSPMTSTANQVERIQNVPGRVELMAELGITAADLLQTDVLLVVEGTTDEQWLKALFPIELGRAHVVVAGSAEQVMAAHATLTKIPPGVPWLCLRDRDLLSDDEVQESQAAHPQLHIWPKRAIESLLLDEHLVAAVVSANGADVTSEEIREWMRVDAEPLKDEVLASLVERELTRLFPPPGTHQGGDRFQRIEQHYRQYALINQNRADHFLTTLEEQRALLECRWPTEWDRLAEPKALIGQLHARVSMFRTASAFEAALVARAREDASVRPEGLEVFRRRLGGVIGAAAPRADGA